MLKQALVQMGAGDDNGNAIHLKAIPGILFFGVPNQGMDIISLYPVVHDQLNLLFLAMLNKYGGQLDRLVMEFNEAFRLRDDSIVSFYQTLSSCTFQVDPSGTISADEVVLVDCNSATKGQPQGTSLPINRNHSDMVKSHSWDVIYNIVCYHLKEFAWHAPAVINNRLESVSANASAQGLVGSEEDPLYQC